MNISYLQKSSSSNNSGMSAKYYISYNKKLSNSNFITKGWLEVLEQLKATNFEDKNKVLLGILEKQNNVVLKISASETLSKEYKYGLLLKDLSGFMKYITYFECKDDYRNHPNKTKNYLCEGDGNQMKVLVMPFITSGNLFDFKWNEKNWNVLHSCIKQSIYTMLQAFDKHKFIHNDTHTKNIMVTKTKQKSIIYKFSFDKTVEVPCYGYKIIFMDFENSLQGDHIPFLYNDIGRLCSDIKFNMNLNIKNMMEFISHIDKNKHKSISELLPSITLHLNNLEWENKLSIDVFKYDPNRF